MGGVGLQQFFICCFVGLAICFQRQMKRDAPVTDQRRALRMLYILYAVLTLITVSVALPIPISNKHQIHTAPGPHHIPPRRVLQRLQQRYPSSRSISIHSRLHPHAHRSRALQHRPSWANHAGQGQRLSQPEAEKGHWEEECEREDGWRFAHLRAFQCSSRRARC